MINEQTQNLEEFMYQLSGWAEICNTKFFTTVIDDGEFDNKNINELLNYLDFLQRSIRIKQTYPKTVKEIPKVIKAIKRVWENKLLMESIK